MRTLLAILLLVCSSGKSQLSDAERKAISHDLRVQIDSTWKKIQYYDYMMPLWHRDRDLGLLEHYSTADTFMVLAHLHRDYARLLDSLTVVERKQNPDGSYKKNPDGSFGWPWPSPFEAKPPEDHKRSPAAPDTMRPSRERPPLIGT
jgi:hypothetical protein